MIQIPCEFCEDELVVEPSFDNADTINLVIKEQDGKWIGSIDISRHNVVHLVKTLIDWLE